MRPLRISMVGSRGIPTTYSGVESALAEICPRLVRRGHQVLVYAASNIAYDQKQFQGVRLRRVTALNTKHLETFTRVMASLTLELFRRSDIVHFHALGPAVFSFLPRLVGKRSVVTVHGLDWQREKWGWGARGFLKAGEWASIRFPNATIVVSPVLETYYEQKYGVRPVCIPNGVNTPTIKEPNLIIKQYGLTRGDYILFASRLVPEKGCHHLIEAFRRLETDKRLVIAGGPGHTRSYANHLRVLSAGHPSILFTGFVSGELLQELFSNAYLYVLPSEVEGLSISLLEAMSYGLCVVTSDIPENRSVTQGVYGYSFRHGDSQDLHGVLTRLLSSSDEVARMGRKAQSHVEAQYSWERIVEKMEAVYLSLV